VTGGSSHLQIRTFRSIYRRHNSCTLSITFFIPGNVRSRQSPRPTELTALRRRTRVLFFIAGHFIAFSRRQLTGPAATWQAIFWGQPVAGKLFIGTSGWLYPHWKGNFYPEDLKTKDQFRFYQQHFDTVELNNSFYRLPGRETFLKWKKTTKPGFIFSVKANRFITHMKKLKDPAEPMKRMMYSARGLGQKLGPVLFQLPPKWQKNTERFREFLKTLPKKGRFVFEFRETSWYEEDILSLLKSKNCAFCIYELAGHLSPLEVTADFVYVRLHGPGNKYQGSYPMATLKKWAARIREWRRAGRDVYVYFDNDQAGYAAFNALTLQRLCL
jgi:uncharacterized protein YecE (DUF72 family)